MQRGIVIMIASRFACFACFMAINWLTQDYSVPFSSHFNYFIVTGRTCSATQQAASTPHGGFAFHLIKCAWKLTANQPNSAVV